MLQIFFFFFVKAKIQISQKTHSTPVKVTNAHSETFVPFPVIILRPLDKRQKQRRGLKQPDAMFFFFQRRGKKGKAVNKQS